MERRQGRGAPGLCLAPVPRWVLLSELPWGSQHLQPPLDPSWPLGQSGGLGGARGPEPQRAGVAGEGRGRGQLWLWRGSSQKRVRVGKGCQRSGQRGNADFILKEVEPASVLGRDSAPMGEGQPDREVREERLRHSPSDSSGSVPRGG